LPNAKDDAKVQQKNDIRQKRMPKCNENEMDATERLFSGKIGAMDAMKMQWSD